MHGFSRANLLSMRAFADAYLEESIVQQLVGQLSWGHNVLLLTKVKQNGVSPLSDDPSRRLGTTCPDRNSRKILTTRHSVSTSRSRENSRIATGEMRADFLILDDAKARQVAEAEGRRLLGLLGLLIEAKVSSGTVIDEMIKEYVEEQGGDQIIDDSRFPIDGP